MGWRKVPTPIIREQIPMNPTTILFIYTSCTNDPKQVNEKFGTDPNGASLSGCSTISAPVFHLFHLMPW